MAKSYNGRIRWLVWPNRRKPSRRLFIFQGYLGTNNQKYNPPWEIQHLRLRLWLVWLLLRE